MVRERMPELNTFRGKTLAVPLDISFFDQNESPQSKRKVTVLKTLEDFKDWKQYANEKEMTAFHLDFNYDGKVSLLEQKTINNSHPFNFDLKGKTNFVQDISTGRLELEIDETNLIEGKHEQIDKYLSYHYYSIPTIHKYFNKFKVDYTIVHEISFNHGLPIPIGFLCKLGNQYIKDLFFPYFKLAHEVSGLGIFYPEESYEQDMAHDHIEETKLADEDDEPCTDPHCNCHGKGALYKKLKKEILSANSKPDHDKAERFFPPHLRQQFKEWTALFEKFTQTIHVKDFDIEAYYMIEYDEADEPCDYMYCDDNAYSLTRPEDYMLFRYDWDSHFELITLEYYQNNEYNLDIPLQSTKKDGKEKLLLTYEFFNRGRNLFFALEEYLSKNQDYATKQTNQLQSSSTADVLHQ